MQIWQTPLGNEMKSFCMWVQNTGIKYWGMTNAVYNTLRLAPLQYLQSIPPQVEGDGIAMDNTVIESLRISQVIHTYNYNECSCEPDYFPIRIAHPVYYVKLESTFFFFS